MKVTVELVAIELPQFGGAKSREIDLADGATMLDALSTLKVDGDPAMLAMMNGEAVPREQWPETPLGADDTISLFRPFKGGADGMSRVYHFVPEKFALCNIRKQRLKVATFDKMNDPFELLGVHLGNEKNRREIQKRRGLIVEKWGVLCFAKDWKNPLLWSHYADSHKGICLGFDVPKEVLCTVEYRQHRSHPLDWKSDDVISSVLWTKFIHWRYEKEQRRFVQLQECHHEGKLYYWPFGKDMKLREIVVGSRCEVGKSKIKDCLGDMRDYVKLIKAREAFKTFRVVTQGRGFSD